jgi:O-acetyl-ADP-ribose deacetylase (regulator of RNase III)
LTQEVVLLEYAQNQDIFACGAEALVNPVNTVGVMGAGIAKAFAAQFPNACAPYFSACREHLLDRPGAILPVALDAPDPRHPGTKWIIHLPTKQHWKNPSSFALIEQGLVTLSEFLLGVESLGRGPIESVAIPALGCGLGGLPWIPIRSALERHLGAVRQRVIVFPPREPVYVQPGKRF